MKLQIKSLAIIAALALSGVAWGQSFDCKKALTKAEKIICSTNYSNEIRLEHLRLKDNDIALAELFQLLLKYEERAGIKKSSSELVSTQKGFLKFRESCTTAFCLNDLYESRIKMLCEQGVSIASAQSSQACKIN